MELIGSGASLGGAISRFFSKKKELQKSIRMCVVGLDNAGKTTILKAMSNEEIQYVMPT